MKITEIKTENKETKKERLAKHRAKLDKMRYELYINNSNSYNL